MHTGACASAEDFPKNPGIKLYQLYTWVCRVLIGTWCFDLAETSSWTGKEVQWEASGVHSPASHPAQAQKEAANQAKAAQTQKVGQCLVKVDISI